MTIDSESDADDEDYKPMDESDEIDDGDYEPETFSTGIKHITVL